MSKAIIQLCIYFCVLGFVVHAQTPDDLGGTKNSTAQLYTILDSLKEYELKQKNLETQIAQIVKSREGLEAQTPSRFKTAFGSLVGDKTYNPGEIAAKRARIRELNLEEISLQSELDRVRQQVLTSGLSLQDINSKTARLPEAQIREILEARRPSSSK